MDDSLLGRLFAELRNEIYQLVVIADKPLVVCKNHATPELSATQPPLTRVCRQIREESLGMFYNGNMFVMELVSITLWEPYPDCARIHARTEEVSAWLQCTSQKHHDTIKHAKLIICKPTVEAVRFADWNPLIKALKQCGYACEGGEQKLDAIMHSITEPEDLTDYADFWNHKFFQLAAFRIR